MSDSVESLDPATRSSAVAEIAAERRLRYAYMELARRFDRRFEALRLGGRLAKWYSAVGHEATTVPAGLALGRGDVLCTLHRDLGAILGYYLDPARTFPETLPGGERDSRPDPEELLYRLACQLLGREGGFSQGVERSYHYGWLAPELGIQHIGMISHLGSMIPVAAGCAWALKRRGSGVAINFIGDGGTSTGDFHEGLNLAAVWRLPLVLVIENNRYAFSTPTNLQYAAERLSDRGLGYGIAACTIDGNDPDQAAVAISEAIARARRGEGPTLIEAMIGRMRGHAEGDDSLKVVPAEELEEYLDADPVPAYGRRLISQGVLTEEERSQIEERSRQLAEEAIERAMEASSPEPTIAHRAALAPAPGRFDCHCSSPGEDISYVDAINRALDDEMSADQTVVLMGQDVGVFEGAFRVTRGLFERWPERVLDTPISESGTLGAAAGAALLGYRPVVEMQFADFVSCGFNQLVNVIAKLYYRWQVPCPLVVRLPVGGGVGAGPFHSQNPEAWFAHTAGLKVVSPATAEDAYALLRCSIQDPNPVIFCEHKFLYRRIKGRLEADPDPRPGRSCSRRDGGDLTLVAYSGSVWTCLDAAEQLAQRGVECEVIDLRTLVPLDLEPALDSLRRTGRAMIVHEAQLTSGFGAEVAARLADRGFAWLDAPLRRVAYPDRPVPYVKALERELLPDAERVVAEALDLLAY